MTAIERNARSSAVKDIRRRNLEKMANTSLCPLVIKEQLKAGNHLQGNSLFVLHCNEIAAD